MKAFIRPFTTLTTLLFAAGSALALNAPAPSASVSATVTANPPAYSQRDPRAAALVDVNKMLDSKVDDAVIVAYIHNCNVNFHLSAADIIALKDHGASPEVLKAMVESASTAAVTPQYPYQTAPAVQAPMTPQPGTDYSQAPAYSYPDYGYDYSSYPDYYPYYYPYYYPSYAYTTYGWPYCYFSPYFFYGGFYHHYPYFAGRFNHFDHFGFDHRFNHFGFSRPFGFANRGFGGFNHSFNGGFNHFGSGGLVVHRSSPSFGGSFHGSTSFHSFGGTAGFHSFGGGGFHSFGGGMRGGGGGGFHGGGGHR